MAMRAVQGAYELGVEVSGRVRVVGFGGLSLGKLSVRLSRHCHCSLTPPQPKQHPFSPGDLRLHVDNPRRQGRCTPFPDLKSAATTAVPSFISLRGLLLSTRYLAWRHILGDHVLFGPGLTGPKRKRFE
jgi:hypothetical protein